jgi:hypothetical protein
MLAALFTGGSPDALACVISHLSCDASPTSAPDMTRDLDRVRCLVRLARTCTGAYAAIHGPDAFRQTPYGPVLLGALLPHPQCFHWLLRAPESLADHSFHATVRAWVEADESHYRTTGTATPPQAALVPLQHHFRAVVYVVIFAVFGAGKRPLLDALFLTQLASRALSDLQQEVTRVPRFWLMFNDFLLWARRLARNHAQDAQKWLAQVDRAQCPPTTRYAREVSGNRASRFHLEPSAAVWYRDADFAWRRACTCALLRLFARQVTMTDQRGPLAGQWRWWKCGRGTEVVWGNTGVRCMNIRG